MRAGNLQITATNNKDNFGFWQSSPDAVPVVADHLYVAQYRVSSDVDDPQESPQIRLRLNSQNIQQADYLVIESSGDGGYSPTAEGKDYLVYFVPPSSALGQPEDLDDMFMAIDLVNFNPQDAPFATTSLDSVVVRRIALDKLPQAETIRTYTFDRSTEGWQFVTVPDCFSTPRSGRSNGALQITATNNKDNFGYWFVLANDIHIEANKLYRGRFTVSTNITDKSKVPTVRCRLSSSNFQATRALEIMSGTDGANSPGQNATTYDVYFLPPQHLVGTPDDGLIIAFDMMNFTPQDSPSATVSLHSVSLQSLDIPSLF
jgi:hypothetical protein